MSPRAVGERLRKVDELWNQTVQLKNTDSLGKCLNYGEEFEYRIIHSGFDDSAYCYCDQCGKTAILSTLHRPIPHGVRLLTHQRIDAEIERFLRGCDCGGRFTHEADPRCPNCRQELSATKCAEFIDRNAPGTLEDWRWQQSWDGLYFIVIEGNLVRDNWIEEVA